MPKILITYVTYSSKSEANRISDRLLEKRFIACANVFPIESNYIWNGKNEKGAEYVSLLKSLPEYAHKIMAEVEEIHEYDVPCIWQMQVNSNESYYKWIQEIQSYDQK